MAKNNDSSTHDGRPFVGRTRERRELLSLMQSGKAEFIAMYGRRRVGKTFLLRHVFNESGACCFYVMGERGSPLSRQLALFQKSLEMTFFDNERLPRIRTWHDAFDLLVAAINQHRRMKPGLPISIFIDELPWLHTRRSTLLSTIDHAWNTELQNIPEVKLTICGSAASWMVRNVIHSKGGLYGRITKTIHLYPFTLAECREFLKARNYQVNDDGVIELYMTFGGIPYYLEQLESRFSPAQNISRLCFGGGALQEEYLLLLKSLFDNTESHLKILRVLSKKQTGLTRTEIIANTGFPSGGRFDMWIEELERSDLIARLPEFSGLKKDERYCIIDEFILFHHAWIQRAPTGPAAMTNSDTYWDLMRGSPSFRTWTGLSFENLCIKHLAQVSRALGTESVLARVYRWSHRPARQQGVIQNSTDDILDNESTPESGAQIDLVIDREDGVISLCEAKFHQESFAITKAYAADIMRKIAVFKTVTRTRKSLHFVIICPQGVTRNEYSRRLVSATITNDDLFAD